MTMKRHWILLGSVLFVTFFILGWFGREVYRQVPPIPDRVITTAGDILMTRDTILEGQTVWQSIGGQQVGTIWGHGAYQAPDWSADWLHREAVALGEIFAREGFGLSYGALSDVDRAGVDQRVKRELRTNTYNKETGEVVVSVARAEAMEEVAAHYIKLFGDDPSLAELREDYAITKNAITDSARRPLMTHFFFWTAWSATTERPGQDVTYTNNWPHEPLVDNRPTSAALIWSMVSVILLIVGVGAMVAWKVGLDREEEAHTPPAHDPLNDFAETPSMRAVKKYGWVVIAMFCLQVGLGALTAHYTVEGDAFFGIPLSDFLPYSLTRTWHIQLAVFWIATAFLAMGLYLAPAVGGKEPKFQKLGVDLLFGALVLVVGGSMAGEWLAIQQKLPLALSFFFGHQGYEYVELGRFWQILLFVGLVLWLILVLRGLWPALKIKGHRRQLILMFAGASGAIGLFYGAGFFYGAKTHISIMEYWRWWVVHLWVEGFMEVFATASLGFLFSRLGLVRAGSAARAVLISASLYLFGGIPGTFHHLYFSGTPVSIMAVGSTFSALEVVPLALIGYEAWETWNMGKSAPWMVTYRWPILFFLGVAFWNLVGAGVFGFLINPPIALYYMQGLNTTPLHGHAALFGVYGLLALGLVLLILRRMDPYAKWKSWPIQAAFWSLNIGLGLMIVLSLLPVGILQTIASVDVGLWYARSADFLQQPHLVLFRWLRMVGDVIFMGGTAILAWFVVGLSTGWSIEKEAK